MTKTLSRIGVFLAGLLLPLIFLQPVLSQELGGLVTALEQAHTQIVNDCLERFICTLDVETEEQFDGEQEYCESVVEQDFGTTNCEEIIEQGGGAELCLNHLICPIPPVFGTGPALVDVAVHPELSRLCQQNIEENFRVDFSSGNVRDVCLEAASAYYNPAFAELSEEERNIVLNELTPEQCTETLCSNESGRAVRASDLRLCRIYSDISFDTQSCSGMREYVNDGSYEAYALRMSLADELNCVDVLCGENWADTSGDSESFCRQWGTSEYNTNQCQRIQEQFIEENGLEQSYANWKIARRSGLSLEESHEVVSNNEAVVTRRRGQDATNFYNTQATEEQKTNCVELLLNSYEGEETRTSAWVRHCYNLAVYEDFYDLQDVGYKQQICRLQEDIGVERTPAENMRCLYWYGLAEREQLREQNEQVQYPDYLISSVVFEGDELVIRVENQGILPDTPVQPIVHVQWQVGYQSEVEDENHFRPARLLSQQRTERSWEVRYLLERLGPLPPPGAQFLKIFVDAGENEQERNEQNNVAFWSPYPDFALVQHELLGLQNRNVEEEQPILHYTVQNRSSAAAEEDLQLYFVWLGSNQSVLDFHWYDAETVHEGQLWAGEIPLISRPEGTVGYRVHVNPSLENPEMTRINNTWEDFFAPDYVPASVSSVGGDYEVLIENRGSAARSFGLVTAEVRFIQSAGEGLLARPQVLGSVPVQIGGGVVGRSYIARIPAKDIPENTDAFELVVDPQNTITEIDERNNVLRHALNERGIEIAAQQGGTGQDVVEDPNSEGEPGVLPGNPLYIMKHGFRRVREALTFDQERKAEYMLEVAEARVKEAEALDLRGEWERANKHRALSFDRFEKAVRIVAENNPQKSQQLVEEAAQVIVAENNRRQEAKEAAEAFRRLIQLTPDAEQVQQVITVAVREDVGGVVKKAQELVFLEELERITKKEEPIVRDIVKQRAKELRENMARELEQLEDSEKDVAFQAIDRFENNKLKQLQIVSKIIDSSSAKLRTEFFERQRQQREAAIEAQLAAEDMEQQRDIDQQYQEFVDDYLNGIDRQSYPDEEPVQEGATFRELEFLPENLRDFRINENGQVEVRRPRQRLVKVSWADCDEQESPVCTADKQSFYNTCHAEVYGSFVAFKGVCDGRVETDVDFQRENPCTNVFEPVCANGQSYQNSCEARQAGERNMVQGACVELVEESEADECSQDVAYVCANNQQTYINRCYAESKGLTVVSEGRCDEEVIEECSDEISYVCANNGQTYINRCSAEEKGLFVTSIGRCEDIQPEFIPECIDNSDCFDANRCTADQCVAGTCRYVQDQSCGATEFNCTDGVDNDRNGSTDCGDAQCNNDPACAPIADCKIDSECEDDNRCTINHECVAGTCRFVDDPYCGATEFNCSDSYDNDGNGSTDCGDAQCNNDPACAPIADCKIDSDCEDDNRCTINHECVAGTCRFVDDPYCGATEFNCSDSYDNDGNGSTDCGDAQCNNDPACAPLPGPETTQTVQVEVTVTASGFSPSVVTVKPGESVFVWNRDKTTLVLTDGKQQYKVDPAKLVSIPTFLTGGSVMVSLQGNSFATLKIQTR